MSPFLKALNLQNKIPSLRNVVSNLPRVSAGQIKEQVKSQIESARQVAIERLNELEVTRKFEVAKNYFEGQDFERDLDELIRALHLQSSGEIKNFDLPERSERIKAKLKYLRTEAAFVVAMCSATGGKIGAKIGRGNPAVIADAAVAGGTVGTMLVGFFAGRVLVRRYLMAGAVEVSKVEVALQ